MKTDVRIAPEPVWCLLV